ncbi:phage portal protein [Methylophaga sp.]|uniref:phage portal protein n=1 Tax=Methylophaga sp. TaxID=2024840 RepID=UPI003A8F9491
MIQPRGDITSSRELSKLINAGAMTDAGVAINPDSAMRVTAVYDCVMVIAETLAQLPFILYEREGENKKRAVNERLYSLLHDMPNDFQTSFDYRLNKTMQILLHGVGYSFINRANNGDVLELLPMRSNKVEFKQNKDFSLSYVFTDVDNNPIPLRQDQVFRILGSTLDGITPMSPIEMHRQTIGIASAADKHAALMFRNGGKMSGVLQNDGHFSSDDVAKRVKESWDESTSGANANKTALLEDGLKWQQVSMSNRDAQYIESRKFQKEDIASIFRVPPHKIGILDRATNNNIEHQGLEFVTDTMMPWNVRWEQSIARDLLGREKAKRFYAELLVDGLMRGDSAARSAFYQSAVGGPWMTINEARKAENRDPVKGGDELIRPLNLSQGESQ